VIVSIRLLSRGILKRWQAAFGALPTYFLILANESRALRVVWMLLKEIRVDFGDPIGLIITLHHNVCDLSLRT
jgi:hypothetical protein